MGGTETAAIDVTLGPCQRKYRYYWACGGFALFVLVIFLCTCWGYLNPTEYGLCKNTVTGSVDKNNVYGGGRHFLGWGKEFITFPAHLTTLSFGSLDSDTRGPIEARTGPAGDDDASSGLPLTLSVSFQYRLLKDQVSTVYSTFGKNWESSYLRFSLKAITDVAQEFAPRYFWERRKIIEDAMALAVNRTLIADGMAQIDHLQLTSIHFQSSYEQTITDIQLQKRLAVTKEFDLQVVTATEDR